MRSLKYLCPGNGHSARKRVLCSAILSETLTSTIESRSCSLILLIFLSLDGNFHSIGIACSSAREMGRRKRGSRGGSWVQQTTSNGTRTQGGSRVSNEKRKGEGNRKEMNENKKLPEPEFGEKERDEQGEESSDGPLGVRSRLTYPLVRAEDIRPSESESESESEDSDEESVELNVRPRFVFVSSLCAVCLEKSRIFCENCRMVSYCGTRHRSQGASTHRDLCEHLREIRSSIASVSSQPFDADQYRAYRLRLLAALESTVARPLELWEKEIVLYPPVCRICWRLCDRRISCPDCAMESFCEDHAGEHEKWCPEFRVYQRCLFLQQRHGCVEPKIPKIAKIAKVRSRIAAALSEITEPSDLAFHRLMRCIYANSSYYRQMDCYTYSTLSQLATIPLTALYAMRICCPDWRDRTDWAIHLLGAEFQFEAVNLRVWEKLFLHFLPNLRRLCLTLIGPELRLPSGVPPSLLSKVKLCSECKSNGRAVRVVFRPGELYHELGKPRPDEPDLICAFNPGLYRKTGFDGKDTWLGTIQRFSEIPAPVAITSYTANEMLWEVARLKSVLGGIQILLEPQRNPFASIKPDRNFVSDHVVPLIYKNYYLTVIKGKSSLL